VPTIAYLGRPLDTPYPGVVGHRPDAPDGELVALLARADAIVFAADGRPDHVSACVALWERVPELLEAGGRPRDLPIIIHYVHGDADAIDDALQIQRFLVIGELRMPNPYALWFPVRVADLGEALAAGARAAVDGPFTIPPDAAEMAHAMLEKQLATQLAALVPNAPDAERLARRTLRGDPVAHARLNEALRDDIADDPALHELVLDRVTAQLEHALVTPDLRCGQCKAAVTLVELAGVRGGPFGIGDPIALDLGTVHVLRAPAAGEPVVWLTAAPCTGCGAQVWCTVMIVDGAIDSVWPAALTRATYERAHVASLPRDEILSALD
jgi:hypothetical protein